MKKTMLPTLFLLTIFASVIAVLPAEAQLGLFSSSLKKGEVYRALDGDTLRVASKDEVEDEHGTVAKYTVDGDKVRIVIAGIKAHYYKITKEGLEEERGRKILYSSANYDTAVRRAEEARIKREQQAKIEREKAEQQARIEKEKREKAEAEIKRRRVEDALKKAKAIVTVKGGCFDMGNTFGDGDSDEKPVHRVCLDDFKMDKYEVTQSAYQSAMGSYHKDCPDCPVERVTWDEAKAYCEHVGKRLPTEAEWEYSARDGGKNVKYGTGKNELSTSDANYSSGVTKPVGSYAPNALGLHDMAGNVWEWVADWHGAYSSGEQKNPKGPSSGTLRVLRGGSWYGDPIYLRASTRLILVPSYRDINIGFRCVQ